MLLTNDGLLAMMSETGVVDVKDEDVLWKGRLGPGLQITMDLATGQIRKNVEVKSANAAKAPYGEWLRKHKIMVTPAAFTAEAAGELGNSTVQQMTAFGWSLEDLDMQVADMSNAGKETLFSLGNDAPLAVLSQNPSTTYDYFKQRFAQVTNPPIDPLREGVVMGLDMSLGRRHDLTNAPSEELAKQLRVESPLLNQADMDAVFAGAEKQGRATATLSTLYPLSSGPDGLEAAVTALCAEAEARVRAGEAEVMVLSDREAHPDGEGGEAATRAAAAGRTAEMTFIPPMIAVGAVHHHLIQVGLRMDTSIIAETAQAWSTHHMNCLVGYGAHAVHPYLLWRAVRHHYELNDPNPDPDPKP